jgi:hypothetical protein
MLMILLIHSVFCIMMPTTDVLAACQSKYDQGRGVVLFDGTQVSHSDIDTCEELSMYLCSQNCWGDQTDYLKDVSRQQGQTLHSHNGNMSGAAIVTDLYSAWTGTTTGFKGMPDCDHSWDDGTFAQRAAVDAHVYAGKTYDYLLSAFGRNSFDSKGGWMTSLVDINCESAGISNGNGYFDPFEKIVKYCSADHTNQVEMSGHQEMVAHEWGHGVTATAARGDLTYSGESGALNESFSDAMGISVRHHYNGGTIDWVLGRGRFSRLAGIRNLANPPDSTMRRVQPDYYGGLNWQSLANCTPDSSTNDYCYVHTNSGVPNKMFYLLTDGGTHSTSGVSVQGLGISKAMRILYDANMNYWQTNENMHGASFGMINAAATNYGGYGSDEVRQVELAWAAVGVGDEYLIQGIGTGSGTINSTSAYIPFGVASYLVPAGYSSRFVYPYGDTVTFTATPDANSVFTGWSNMQCGGEICIGTGPCTATPDVGIRAVFDRPALNVTKTGTGGGTVTSAPAGISCGADCSEIYSPDASVTLTATPDSASFFSGWLGACSGTGTCIVTMNSIKNVTASLNLYDSGG